MNFQELLKNKPLLYTIIGVCALVLIFMTTIITVSASKNNSTRSAPVGIEKGKEDINLLTTDNLGKALEIQALLARQGITASRVMEGTKSKLILPKRTYTMVQRDAAILAIVKSGLMDQNVGLEIFDKGDFTSTKEDKRIRLSRAINGELARLIRQIGPIQSASVFVSIPEQTMFAADKKPITATVQLVLNSGDGMTTNSGIDRLSDNYVRAIENLLLGSINGLELDNISISDTGGNVYKNIISAQDDLLARMQENDKYMSQKVSSQLDKLVGKGNYVATVSTFLVQAPIDKTSVDFDPTKKTAITEQTFSEGLGDQTRDSNQSLSAVSVYLPNGLPTGGGNSAQNRSYSRTARETQYGVPKIQTTQYTKAGAIEEISIAVTLDQSAIPVNVSLDELKKLIATAASPKALPENVQIAFSDKLDPFLASDRPTSLPKPDSSGNPWWVVGVILFIGLIFGFNRLQHKFKADAERQRLALEQLQEKTDNQERQLRDVNLKAAELIEKQTQLAQGLIEQQHQPRQQSVQVQTQQPAAIPELMETLADLSDDIEALDEDELANEVKSWIER